MKISNFGRPKNGAGTHFWIDREQKLFGLFMTRAREFSFGIQKEFRKAVYSAQSL